MVLKFTDRQIAVSICAIAVIALCLNRSNGRTLRARQDEPLYPLSEDTDQSRGRSADVPEDIPRKGLYDVLWRVVHEVSGDRVALVAAGVTFYLLLALFPALGAIVALYGLLADPVDIAEHLRTLAYVLPPGAFDILATQVRALVQIRDATLSLAFFIGFAIALLSARNGTLALFDAMNVAYQEVEKRGFVRLNLIAIVFTLCAMIALILMIVITAALSTLLRVAFLDPTNETVVLLAGWSLVVVAALTGAAVVYRVGPSRQPAKLRWLTWGSVFATSAWIVMSLGYAWYLNNLANYAASYGALGGLVGFLIWLWLSVTLLIVGAELNAELEHQTAKDSTTGRPLPMGLRGAHMADTIGKAAR
ncbi:YihY/virulence factor BrkB family protein [Ensifer sp. Root278]|uniref:YihY/virulence factor BrkB family protein n=1 Tax=Ensifer sp. Root278 TaxID=1736509 RepID=UPI00070F349A|nr:YihY/virulence factor BrkB family protein [Ensifer sp. Root278]KRD64935.1 ribonuclease [Ensifer sp. Root278]